MIDNTRRNIMKFIALLGVSMVVGVAAPVRIKVSIKERKRAFEANYARVGQGYYGFGETW